MRRGIFTVALCLAASCANNPTNVLVRALDRPTAVDFVCYGQPLIPAYGNVTFDPATGDVDVEGDLDPAVPPVNRPQPSTACTQVSRDIEYALFIQGLVQDGVDEENLPSQAEVEGVALGRFRPDVFGFILESDSGTLALARLGLAPGVQDTDPFTPDRNAISVGELPVDLATDASGCHVTVANAGSCDIATVDVQSALSAVLERTGAVAVDRRPITNAFGQRLAVSPAAVARSPQQVGLGDTCPSEPLGVVYLALPACSLVAAVDPASGQMLAGVAFDGATPRVVDGSFSCPVECGAVGGANLGEEPAGLRPTALEVTRENQLIVGASDSNVVSVVNLGDDGLPVAGQAFSVALEGDVGVTEVVTTGPVQVGGDSGEFGAGLSGERDYIYAIATDRSVRVVDIGSLTECDTQVDPRYLTEATSASLLACLPVGGADTPPRRPLAEGPGIRLPLGVVPTGLEPFVQAVNAREGGVGLNFAQIDGGTLVGHFMLVTGSNGAVHVVNVDDDLYPDSGTLESGVYLPLALPHQLRDSLANRGGTRDNCQQLDELQVNTRGPRGTDFVQTFDGRIVSRPNLELLPNTARVGCIIGTDDGEAVPDEDSGVAIDDVPELSFVAPIATRQWAFPDLAAVLDERWAVTYEGLLTRDDLVPIDGPIARLGAFRRDGGALVLQDNSAPFCATGVEPFDIVNLIGCVSNFDCGPTEQCVFSPEAPAGVTNGLCAPSDRAEAIESACRDLLVTSRRFSALDSNASTLTLVPRREVLEVTPVDGCTSDDQCEEFAALAQRVNGENALEDTPPLTDEERDALRGQFACEPDPSRRPGRNWCALRCDDTVDDTGFPVDPCAPGQACVDNRCVQGVVPPAECLDALQAYSLAAGESFVAVSARVAPLNGRENPTFGRTATGYLHPLVVDDAEGSDACIEDPNANRLLRGRIRPYDLPECTEPVTDVDATGPNPCLVSDFENDVLVTEDGQTRIETEVRRAVRFSNPIFTFHILLPVNVFETSEGPVEYSVLHPGLGFTFEIGGGFSAFRALGGGLLRRPSSIERGPTGRIYVTDEGDVAPPVNARGQLLVIAAGVGLVNDLLSVVAFETAFVLR